MKEFKYYKQLIGAIILAGIMIMMAPEQAVNVHMDMVQKASARKNGNGAYVNGN